MAIATQSEKERKRRIVVVGRIQGKAQAAIASVRGGGRWGHYGGTSGDHTANARWR
jgi:hypothetical protein